MQYPKSTKNRAMRALKCGPFQLALFTEMRSTSVPLNAIFSKEGVKNSYTKLALSELAVENYLQWLIEVGILRREVDGQGITDRFRLTPLGSELVAQWQQQGWGEPTTGDRIYNFLSRFLRI